MPLPFAEVIALDLADSAGRASAVRAAQRAVNDVDGERVAAWLGLGASLFHGTDTGAGMAAPRKLVKMPTFSGDLLDPGLSHGDLLLQITATTRTIATDAARQALHALPQWRVRWRIAGHRPDNRAENGRGLARNPFGFTEGYGNPANTHTIADRTLIRPGQGEPDWTTGGTYQVVRIIRLATQLWNQDPVRKQERIIGRRQNNGRWLDGTPVTQHPDFATDLHGRTTPLDAHVRRAVPDPHNPPPLVRRSYTYDHGNDDQGLIFSCFQHDPTTGFETVQKRLHGETLATYTLTTGGGYFYIPTPGNTWLNTPFPL